LREVVREQQLQLVDGLHLVIIARWRAPDASLEDLRHDLLRTARRAGILKA
jgi:RNase P protein component